MAINRAASTEQHIFDWEGKDRAGKTVSGELRAQGPQQVQAMLRRRGVLNAKVSRRKVRGGRRIRPKDVAVLTRQLSTMMKAGVPLLQSFDIVGRDHANPRVARMLSAIRADVETGTALSAAFRKYPQHFSALYCNLIEAGEAAGILDELLDRLATYMEKIEGVKSKIKSALMYPTAVLAVAFIVIAIIMVFVVPAFQEVFSSFGADLPLPTLAVIAASAFFIDWWWLMLGMLVGGTYGFMVLWKRDTRVQFLMDRLLLKLPVFGPLMRKSVVARWTRTLSTMFAAGVPLVEALDSVGGASGNSLYAQATRGIQQEVATGTSLTQAMSATRLFPPMVLQMAVIGEESGALDHMLAKSADFYESEVDDRVAGLSSLMEPVIIVLLGTLIGGIVVAMYLPIFKLGQVV
ncbi:MAG: type II secretion system F family protein [Comamonas sp.]